MSLSQQSIEGGGNENKNRRNILVFDETEDLEFSECAFGVESMFEGAFNFLDGDILVLLALGMLVLSLDNAAVSS